MIIFFGYLDSDDLAETSRSENNVPMLWETEDCCRDEKERQACYRCISLSDNRAFCHGAEAKLLTTCYLWLKMCKTIAAGQH